MIIHSPIVSGSLTFANGATFTLPTGGVYSGSFSGSYQGTTFAGGTFTGNGSGLTFGGTGIISGSSQLTTEFDARYLNTDGDGIVSSSAQVISLLPTGVVSGSSQIVSILTPLNTFSGSQENKNTTLGTYTGSVDTKFTTLGTYTGSVDTKFTTLGTYTGSNDTKWSTLGSLSGSFAKIDSANTFVGIQTISGSFKLNDVSSNFSIVGNGFGQTYLNSLDGALVLNPGYGGVQIVGTYPNLQIDGTIAATSFGGAINATNGVVSGSSQIVSILGPLNTFSSSQETKNTTLGTYTASLETKNSTLETYTASLETKNTTLGTYTASLETKNSNLATTTGSLLSSQTNLNAYTGSLLNAFQVTGSKINFLGDIVVYGTQSIINSQNVQIADNILYLSPTASTDTDLGIVGHYNDGTYRHAGIFMDASDGHAWKVFNGLTDETLGTVNTSGTGFTLADFKAGAFTGTSFTGIHNGTINSTNGVVSGSSQIAFSGVTGTVSNAQLANSTISGISLGSNLATLTIGTGLSGTSYNGSGAVTIANTGVTSFNTRTGAVTLAAGDVSGLGAGIISGSSQITGLTNSNLSGTAGISNANLANSSVTVTAGTGMSGGGAVSLGGSVTLTNAGVTSNVAGTGVSVSGATGAVTISIGQAVATTSNVQFNSLGIGMAASATAGRIDATNDIVAYSSSDIRFKENITPIENAIDKINQIGGYTYDWKEENKIEHGYDGNDVGVIAQEIEAVLPQLVQTRESGYKAVKYDKLVALLIEGIKEQQYQIDELRNKIEKLENGK